MENIGANALGIIAMFGSAFLAVPQMVRSVRFGTRGVSSATFQIFVAADIAWFAYSATHNLWISALGNVSCIATGSVILYCIIRDGARIWDTTKILLLIIALSLIWGTIDLTLLIWWGGSLSFALRVPQARNVFSRRDISDVSASTWLICAASNILWTGYGFLLHDAAYAYLSAMIAVLSLTLVIGIVWRRNAKELLQKQKYTNPISANLVAGGGFEPPTFGL